MHPKEQLSDLRFSLSDGQLSIKGNIILMQSSLFPERLCWLSTRGCVCLDLNHSEGTRAPLSNHGEGITDTVVVCARFSGSSTNLLFNISWALFPFFKPRLLNADQEPNRRSMLGKGGKKDRERERNWVYNDCGNEPE